MRSVNYGNYPGKTLAEIDEGAKKVDDTFVDKDIVSFMDAMNKEGIVMNMPQKVWFEQELQRLLYKFRVNF